MAKRCVVVGGTSELGKVLCELLHEGGTRVGFTYHQNEERARGLAERTLAPCERLDLTRTEDIEGAIDRLAERLGGLDALVHCAVRTSATESAESATDRFEPLEAVSSAGFDRLFAINVKSAFFSAVRAVRHMSAGGEIVLLGSIDGLKSVPSPAAYASSKGAVGALARSLAKELGPKGVRVNVVAPGILESGASRVIPAAVRAEYLKHTCAKRYGTLEEAANLVAWLVQHNTYVTGQSIALDGGL